MCIIGEKYTHLITMRTNIVINDDLMKEALDLSGVSTKREVVELALQTLVTLKRQEKIKDLKGKLHWTGDLDEMRSDG